VAYTSRTISGEIRCLSSSSFRSLQHVPRSCTPHLLPNGCSSDRMPASCCCLVWAEGCSSDHTACVLAEPFPFFGSETAVDDDDEAALVLQQPLALLPQHDMVGEMRATGGKGVYGVGWKV